MCDKCEGRENGAWRRSRVEVRIGVGVAGWGRSRKGTHVQVSVPRPFAPDAMRCAPPLPRCHFPRQVCDVCGLFIQSTDTEARRRDHVEGKQYLGWLAIRQKLAELGERQAAGAGGGGGSVGPPAGHRWECRLSAATRGAASKAVAIERCCMLPAAGRRRRGRCRRRGGARSGGAAAAAAGSVAGAVRLGCARAAGCKCLLVLFVWAQETNKRSRPACLLPLHPTQAPRA